MSRVALEAAFKAARKAKEELRSLYDTAEARDDSALTVEEQAKETRLHDEITKQDERQENLLKSMELDERAAKAVEDSKVDGGNGKREERKSDEPTDSERLLAIVNGETRADTFMPERRDNVTLTAGTATDGAEVVPTTLFGQLTAFMRENATVMNNGARTINTSGGEDLVFPRVTSYSAASIVAEEGTIGKDAPQFDTVTIEAYKYGFMVLLSYELTTDQGFDIVPWVVSQGGEALSRGVGAHLISGSGSGQPNGIFTAATTGVTAAGAAAITADELIDLQHSIASPYRANATWVCKDSTLKLIRKLKDGDNQYLWRPGLLAGHPDTILGNPIVTDDNAPAATTGLDSVLYGDLNGYVVRFAGGARVTRSDEYGYDSDTIAWRFLVRADGDLVDTSAVRVLTQA